jgi:hypothetical protein
MLEDEVMFRLKEKAIDWKDQRNDGLERLAIAHRGNEIFDWLRSCNRCAVVCMLRVRGVLYWAMIETIHPFSLERTMHAAIEKDEHP